jgi:uncharacterized protein (DUF2147 family)
LLFSPTKDNAIQVKADDVIGIYWSPKKDGKVEIYKRNNKYYGKTIWSKNNSKDVKNPDASLRDRPVLGLEFLKDFVFDDDEWVDGTVYDPTSGKLYSCKMWLENGDLMLKGYIGISLIGRSEKLEKVR